MSREGVFFFPYKMKPTIKVSGFWKGWRCSSLKPQAYPAGCPSSSAPQISPVQCWDSRNEKHPSFHEQWQNNLLLFSQRQMNLQTALESGRDFWIKDASPLSLSKSLLPFALTKRYPPALESLSPARLSHRHWSQVFLQSPLPPLFLYLFFFKKNCSLIMVILSEVTAQSTVK